MSHPNPGEWPDPYTPSSGAGAAHEPPTQPVYPAGAPHPPPGGPPGYGAPGYAYPAYPPSPTTNGLAIASLVCSLAGLAVCISAPVGAILGHVARKQIRERGEQGDGMALAGIIVGWILTGLCGLGAAGYITAIIFAISQESATM